jgi:hypothetical protein
VSCVLSSARGLPSVVFVIDECVICPVHYIHRGLPCVHPSSSVILNTLDKLFVCRIQVILQSAYLNIVRESAKFLRKKRCESLLLKLDIAKAFDTVAWQYLLEILQRKGFESRWLN